MDKHIRHHLNIIIMALFAFTHSLFAQPTEWKSVGIGGGGALFSPSISPHNPEEIFMACDMTNLFHTTSSGKNWTVIPFPDIRAFPETHIQFTSDPEILYTLHFDFIADRKVPVKSNDGGNSWSVLSEDPTDGEAYYLFADPHNTNRLIVSSYDQIYFSKDGGGSFISIYSNDQNQGAYIGGTFWHGADIYIAVSAGVLISNDNGDDFTLQEFSGISANEGIVSFSASNQNNTTRFYAVTLNSADVYPGVSGAEHWGYQGCYVLDFSASQDWTKITDGLGTDDHPYFIRASTTDPNIAYLAGGNGETFYPIVFKTINGGNDWDEVFFAVDNRNINTGWSGYEGDTDWWYGEYALGFAISPTDPNVAIFTDLGYAHLTIDGGKSWNQLYVDEATQNPAGGATPTGKSYQGIGLENTSCWWVTWLDPIHIFASFTDVTAIRSVDGGTSWSRDYQNLDYNSTYQTILHPPTGILYAAVSNIHDIYQSTYLQDDDFEDGDGSIMYSEDGGVNWQTLHDFDHPVIWMTHDPADANTLFASVVSRSAGDVYRTSNLDKGSASTWTRLSSPPRTEGHPFNILVLQDGNLVSTYSGRRDAGGSFTNSSGVFISSDGGNTWQDRSDPGMFYWTKDICVDPHDSSQSTWYVSVFSGWGGAPNSLGGIYKTSDRGQSWTRISDLDRVESCTVHPSDPDIMYVTTEAEGLWYTDNLRHPTPAFAVLPEYPFQHPVRIFFDPYDDNNVWITSFGNGLRVGQQSATLTANQYSFATSEIQLTTYPNPTSGQIHMHLKVEKPMHLNISVFNLLGRKISSAQRSAFYSKGEHWEEIDLTGLTAGIYFLKLQNGRKQVLRKIHIQRESGE